MELCELKQDAKRMASAKWLIPASIVGLSILIMLIGDAGKELLRYDRAWIGQGEFWRLISGHFAHLTWSHLALNSAGLILVWYLVGPNLKVHSWLFVILITIVTMDTAFWLMNPHLYWYLGMSGLLHGMLLAGIVTRLPALNLELSILLLLLVAKISYEQFGGSVPGSEAASGGPVIVDAHLYGALGGILGALLEKFRAWSRRAI
jgi:rhomboid family GlyGly-CTERM serine protease|tara:strand:- start:2027 stop:2641 length:615 start_codon:yes stop_codon:yes gene_type:complete